MFFGILTNNKVFIASIEQSNNAYFTTDISHHDQHHKHRHRHRPQRLLTNNNNNESTRDNPEFYEPTAIELQQGVVFAAPKYWGVHLRRSKSLHVAFIGGSQTSTGDYVEIFQESMNSTASSMGWSFTVYNI